MQLVARLASSSSFLVCFAVATHCIAQDPPSLSDDTLRFASAIRTSQQDLMDILYEPNSQLTFDEKRDLVIDINILDQAFQASVAYNLDRDQLLAETWDEQLIDKLTELLPLPPLPPVNPALPPFIPPGAPGNPLPFPIPNPNMPGPNPGGGPAFPPVPPPPPPLFPKPLQDFFEDIGELIAEIAIESVGD